MRGVLGLSRVRRAFISIAVSASLILTGLPFLAGTGQALFTGVQSSQITHTCDIPGQSGTKIMANYGGSSEYGYNAPAPADHPQFYAGLEGFSICAMNPDMFKITVTGTYPDGTPLEGSRFTSLAALTSPQENGVYAELMNVVFGVLSGLAPPGISPTVRLLTSGSGLTTGFNSNSAWGQWKQGIDVPSGTRGLRFAYQLAVDPSRAGMYKIHVTYHAEFWHTHYVCPVSCSQRVMGADLTHDLEYCYLRCNPPLVNNAVFVAWNVPSTMTPGQSTSVSITLQNSGTTTWHPTIRTPEWVPASCTDCPAIALGSQNPVDNTLWGLNRVPLAGSSTLPGQSRTFSFTITAPTTPGVYNFQWKMVQESVQWFGAPTPNGKICVATSCYQLGPINAKYPNLSPLDGADIDVYPLGVQTSIYHAVTGPSGTVAGLLVPAGTYEVDASKCTGYHLYFGYKTVTLPPSQSVTIVTRLIRSGCL